MLVPGIDEIVEERTDLERQKSGGDTGAPYRVILYNDEWHGQDEVVIQLQKATGYILEKCVSIMMEAHRRGRAICFHGNRSECQRVARVLREIQLQCEVDCN